MSASNARFAEYATSGAFSLSLTRNQVSTLSMVAAGAGAGFGSGIDALERKGLVEVVANPTEWHPDDIEFRATFAGLRVADLLGQAGLTNGPNNNLTAELTTLRAEIDARRAEATAARRDARSAMARMQEAERELEDARAKISRLETEIKNGIRLRQEPPPPFRLRLRDPMPERSNADLIAAIQEREPA